MKSECDYTNKYFLLFWIILFHFPVKILHADTLNDLICQLESFEKDPSKISLHYDSERFQRSPTKKKIIREYEKNNLTFKNIVAKIFQHQHAKEIQRKKNETRISSISTSKIIEEFKNIQAKGEVLKTGDLVFIHPSKSFSDLIAHYTDSHYSHGGLLWIRNGKPIVIEINPKNDLILIPLADYLVPKYPKNCAIAIFRYTQDIDLIEMEYLFHVFEKNQDHIFFDPLFLRNRDISIPEIYFKNHVFLYCTEFIYLIYQNVLKQKDFLSPYRINMKAIASDYITHKNTMAEAILNSLQEIEQQTWEFIVTYNNFTLSKDFKPILEIHGSPLPKQKNLSNDIKRKRILIEK